MMKERMMIRNANSMVKKLFCLVDWISSWHVKAGVAWAMETIVPVPVTRLLLQTQSSSNDDHCLQDSTVAGWLNG